MTKLVAFDLDGTLNMTHTYAVAAYQEALKELGAGPVAESVIRSRFGAPFRDDSLFFLGMTARKPLDAFTGRWRGTGHLLCVRGRRPIPESRKCLGS